jgi:hypothetical protein
MGIFYMYICFRFYDHDSQTTSFAFLPVYENVVSSVIIIVQMLYETFLMC